MSDGFSVRELYRDASAPGFSASARGRDLVHSLERGLQSLPVEAGVQLLQRLLLLTEDRVWPDDESTKQQLDKMKASTPPKCLQRKVPHIWPGWTNQISFCPVLQLALGVLQLKYQRFSYFTLNLALHSSEVVMPAKCRR